MADGGWIHYWGDCYNENNSDNTKFLEYLDRVVAVFEKMPNWTCITAPYQYVAAAAYVMVFRNSVTTAEISMLFVRDSSGTFMSAFNNISGAALDSYDFEFSTWVAYCPPGSTFGASGLGHPASAGYVPPGGFLFTQIDGSPEVDNDGAMHRLHLLVRDDDDIIMMWSYYVDDSVVIDRTAFMGGFITPVHSGDTSTEGLIANYRGNWMTSYTWTQYFAADGTTRIVTEAGNQAPGMEVSRSDNFFIIGDDYSKWPPIPVVIAGTDDVTTDSKIKGYINPEWFRMIQSNGPAPYGTTFNSGDFVYIQRWGLVGWDSSNDPLK